MTTRRRRTTTEIPVLTPAQARKRWHLTCGGVEIPILARRMDYPAIDCGPSVGWISSGRVEVAIEARYFVPPGKRRRQRVSRLTRRAR